MHERWMEHASCADLPRDTFFPTDGGGVVAAQRICATCPVMGACLEYALRHRVEHGVWGGCSERKRRRILSERSRELVAVASSGGEFSSLEVEQGAEQDTDLLIG